MLDQRAQAHLTLGAQRTLSSTLSRSALRLLPAREPDHSHDHEGEHHDRCARR